MKIRNCKYLFKIILTTGVFMLFLNAGIIRSATVNITVADLSFSPSYVNVNVGDTVTWTLKGSQINSITCNGIFPGTNLPAGALPWNAVLDVNNKQFSYVVRVQGDYDYLSVYNSDVMKGTIHAYTLLPVELSDFVATTIKNEVILDWTTVGETNNDRFEIQRIEITDMKIDDPSVLLFSTVGHLTGNGTTSELTTYEFRDRELKSGTYLYRLKQIDFNSNYIYHVLAERVEIGIPSKFSISQNYPNPFNPSTKISFEIPSDGFVNLNVYDVNGRLINTLLNENLSAGYQSIDFSANSGGVNLSSGVYFYTIEYQSDNTFQRLVKRMMLVK